MAVRRIPSTCTGEKRQKSSGGGGDSKEQKAGGEKPKEDGQKEDGAGGKDAGKSGEDGRKDEDAGDNGKGSKEKVPKGKKPEEPHAEQKQSDKHDIKGEQPLHASWKSLKVACLFSTQQAAHIQRASAELHWAAAAVHAAVRSCMPCYTPSMVCQLIQCSQVIRTLVTSTWVRHLA